MNPGLRRARGSRWWQQGRGELPRPGARGARRGEGADPPAKRLARPASSGKEGGKGRGGSSAPGGCGRGSRPAGRCGPLSPPSPRLLPTHPFPPSLTPKPAPPGSYECACLYFSLRRATTTCIFFFFFSEVLPKSELDLQQQGQQEPRALRGWRGRRSPSGELGQPPIIKQLTGSCRLLQDVSEPEPKSCLPRGTKQAAPKCSA